jgi:uncharacterized protein YabE (DUF348 family)/3D (Asp-Asp-Asp) domain-containing protein
VANKRLSNPGMMWKRHTGIAERMRVRAREYSVPTGSASAATRAMPSGLPVAKIALVIFFSIFAILGIVLGVKAFAKSKELNVRIENGIAPIPVDVVTTARSVRELLAQNNIRLGPEDDVTPALNTKLTDSMVVLVNRAMIVYITSKGQTYPRYMTGGTVEDALNRASISYDQDDEISPSLDTKLSAGIRITHIAVDKEVVTEFQNIDFNTTYVNTSTLLKGKTQVSQPGELGEQSRQIEVTYKDGVEVDRTEISDMVTKEAKPRIILQGTGTVHLSTATSSTGSSGSSGGSDGGIAGIYSSHYKGIDPSVDCVVPAIPSKFDTILYMTITAYTHTGRTTACGNWPQFTRTLKKPGTIAVDPKSIPYGTLLYVTGYGYCVAEDTGSNTVDSSRMGDVFMNTTSDCYKWGRRRNVTVYVIQSGYKR